MASNQEIIHHLNGISFRFTDNIDLLPAAQKYLHQLTELCAKAEIGGTIDIQVLEKMKRPGTKQGLYMPALRSEGIPLIWTNDEGSRISLLMHFPSTFEIETIYRRFRKILRNTIIETKIVPKKSVPKKVQVSSTAPSISKCTAFVLDDGLRREFLARVAAQAIDGEIGSSVCTKILREGFGFVGNTQTSPGPVLRLLTLRGYLEKTANGYRVPNITPSLPTQEVTVHVSARDLLSYVENLEERIERRKAIMRQIASLESELEELAVTQDDENAFAALKRRYAGSVS